MPYGLAVVPEIASPLVANHSPISWSRQAIGWGITPSAVGPTFRRKLPPLEATSISVRTSVRVSFQSSSYDLNPQVSFIVMQVPHSTPASHSGDRGSSDVRESP